MLSINRPFDLFYFVGMKRGKRNANCLPELFPTEFEDSSRAVSCLVSRRKFGSKSGEGRQRRREYYVSALGNNKCLLGPKLNTYIYRIRCSCAPRSAEVSASQPGSQDEGHGKVFRSTNTKRGQCLLPLLSHSYVLVLCSRFVVFDVIVVNDS